MKVETSHIHKNAKSQETPKWSNPLLDKVVLLISSDSTILPSLMTQLAENGADIVLVCRQFSEEAIELARSQVENAGRRLYVIEETPTETHTVSQLVDTIIDKLGRLDFFIDLSARPKKRSFPPEEQSQNDHSFTPHWQLMRSVLKEMA